MKYYPLFLDLKGKECLVIGGGNVALEKITTLLKSGANITVVAVEILPSIRRFSRRINFIQREFQLTDISEKYLLVFAATGDHQLNQTVSHYCAQRRILCNTVDDPKNCHFIVPAIFRKGELTIAVSTSGASPMLAKWIKGKLSRHFGWEYAALTRLMKDLRQDVFRRFGTQETRLHFWKSFFALNPLKLIQNRKLQKLKNEIEKLLTLFSQKLK